MICVLYRARIYVRSSAHTQRTNMKEDDALGCVMGERLKLDARNTVHQHTKPFYTHMQKKHIEKTH